LLGLLLRTKSRLNHIAGLDPQAPLLCLSYICLFGPARHDWLTGLQKAINYTEHYLDIMEAPTLMHPRLFGETPSIHGLCGSRCSSASVHPPRPHGGPFQPEEPLRNVESLVATAAHQTQLAPYNFTARPGRNSITDVTTFSGLYVRQRDLPRLTLSTQNGGI